MNFCTDFIHLLYPKTCLSCGTILRKNEIYFCSYCQNSLALTGYENEINNPVERHFWGRVIIESATAQYFFVKQGVIQDLLHRLKYQKEAEIGKALGLELGRRLKESERFSNIDLIIPVPLHPKKLKKRGYNQSALIAEAIGMEMQKEVLCSILIKSYITDTQTRKNRFNRWENVKESFALSQEKELANKHILLVDDVITTGATLESCTRILQTVEGVRVSIACLASPEK